MLALYAVSVVLVTAQKGFAHPANFLLFRCAFERVVAGQNLYLATPACGGFLYSPAFAVLFAPFAVVPPLLGLLLWNALNAGAIYVAVTRLLPWSQARLVLLFVYLDVVRSLQNSQSNALVAGLLVLAFVAYQRGRPLSAALALGVGTLTKIFPAGGGIFALLYPRRLRAVLVFGGVGLALALVPLLVTTPTLMVHQYQWWLARTTETATLRGQSLLGILTTWFGYAGPNWPVQLVGVLALLAPLALRRDAITDAGFRLLFLSSLLIFVVVFNHQAESPSYVIATTGIGVWVATRPPASWRYVLAMLALIMVSLAATSLITAEIRSSVVRAYSLQAVPCVLCWLAIQGEIWSYNSPK
jgi:hypothetical protein